MFRWPIHRSFNPISLLCHLIGLVRQQGQLQGWANGWQPQRVAKKPGRKGTLPLGQWPFQEAYFLGNIPPKYGQTYGTNVRPFRILEISQKNWGNLNGLVEDWENMGKPQPETIDFPIKIMGTNPLGTSNDDDLGLARNGLETSIWDMVPDSELNWPTNTKKMCYITITISGWWFQPTPLKNMKVS